MKLFGEKRIYELFSDVETKIKSCVSARSHDALTKDIEIFAKEIYPLVAIHATLKLIKENTTVNTIMKKISTNKLTYSTRMFATRDSYDLACVNYFIPFEGNGELFKYQPTKHSNYSYKANIKSNNLHIELQTQYANVKLDANTQKEVSDTIKLVVDKIEENINEVNNECLTFNETLNTRIIKAIQEYRKNDNDRKQQEIELNPFI